MEPIEVIVRFMEDGEVIPLTFTHQGVEHRVVSTGRRWRDASGSHILVMIPGGKVSELLQVPDTQRWYLFRVGLDRMVA